jgi:hypothetical protein
MIGLPLRKTPISLRNVPLTGTQFNAKNTVDIFKTGGVVLTGRRTFERMKQCFGDRKDLFGMVRDGTSKQN